MAAGKRYKFQGSTFQVQTAVGTNKPITEISKADPAVVTSAAHGAVLGDVLKMTVPTASGMTELNGNLYAVDDPLTNTVELAGVDSTDYTTFVLNSPNGAFFNLVTFSQFCELTGVNQQDGSADEIEVTTICSNAKEFELGLSDSGSLQLDFNWAGNQAVQAAMRAAKSSGDQLAFKIVFPGDGGSVIMLGNVQSTSFQGAVNGVWTGSATIKLTGEIFVLEAA
jgi:hypothetical protein